MLQKKEHSADAVCMTPKDAITAHVNWKLRIHALLTGKLPEKLDPTSIARDNVCELGKWIYGEGKVKMPAAQHATLVAAHGAFHKEAARIVSEVYAGHKIGLEAIDMNAPFGKLTTQVVGILSKLDPT
jgi:methyl-accepting chemotaxis protein